MVSLVDPAILQSVADEITNQKQRSTDEAIKVSSLPLLHTPDNSSSSSSSSSLSSSSAVLLLSSSGTPAQELEYSKYAIFSTIVTEREQAVNYLQRLYDSGYKSSETAFWLTVGYMEIGKYSQARQILTTLVRSDPSNEKAAALLEIYKDKVKQNGWQGIGVVIGGIALGILGTGLLIYWYKNRGSSSNNSVLPSTKDWVTDNLHSNNRINGNNSSPQPTAWRGSSGTSSASSGSNYRRY